MATVTSTIIQAGGGDYTDVATWEADTPAGLNGGADVWEGVISDSANYDEVVDFDIDGTGVSSHVRLTVASGHRHSGVYTTSKARMAYTGAATSVIQIQADWVHIEYLQIFRPTGGSIGPSDEGLRFNNDASNCVLSKCLFGTSDNFTNDTDGIYFSNGTYDPTSIDNCVIWGWARGGIHVQATSSITVTLNLDWVTIIGCGESGGTGSEEAPLSLRADAGTLVLNAYNCIFKEQATGAGTDDIYIDPEAVTPNFTLNGSHNCWDNLLNDGGTPTQNWTDQVNATAGVVTTDTANAVIITTDALDATFDATPQNFANNVILGVGLNRQGSEPDSRQDFSVDIAGNTRPTTNVDLGAFQISAAGGGPVTGTATLAYGGTVTASGQRIIEGTATLDGGGTTSASGQPTRLGTAALDYGGQVDAVGTIPTGTVEGTATLNYGGTTTVDGQRTAEAAATVDYGGTVTADGQRQPQGTAELTYGGTTLVDGQPTRLGTATLNYGGTVDAIGTIPGGPIIGTATLTYGGTVDATGRVQRTGTVTLDGGGQVDATGTATRLGTADLDYGGQVDATGVIPTDDVTGTVELDYGGAVSAGGRIDRLGTVTADYGGTVTASGRVDRFGTVELDYGGQVAVNSGGPVAPLLAVVASTRAVPHRTETTAKPWTMHTKSIEVTPSG